METENEMCDCVRGEDEPLHVFQARCAECDKCKGWGREEALWLIKNKPDYWKKEC